MTHSLTSSSRPLERLSFVEHLLEQYFWFFVPSYSSPHFSHLFPYFLILSLEVHFLEHVFVVLYLLIVNSSPHTSHVLVTSSSPCFLLQADLHLFEQNFVLLSMVSKLYPQFSHTLFLTSSNCLSIEFLACSRCHS